MIIFPKKDIVPIIIPQICFNDIYNNINSYVEMNPSIFIEEDGNINILVRCVNYKKYMSKQFTLYGNNSNSIYYIINGKIKYEDKLDIENFQYNLLDYNYNLPLFPTYWGGLEDIRFIDNKNILVNVPQLNEGGNPTLFKAELINNVISNFVECKPNIIEKNWMPYCIRDDPYCNINDYKVIYSLNPFIIKSIEHDEPEEIQISELNKLKLEGYHGSTNGIILNKYERLFLIHINKNITSHRWLLFNVKTKHILISDEFIFFKNSYIEFNCSLTKYKDRIFISIGVNDDKAYIIETCNEDIINIFPKYNNDEKYPTIVTMLYDIRSMENNQIDRNRNMESYIDFSKQFLLKLPFPIIFFIDDNEETYDAICNSRNECNLLDKTYIFMNDFKTTYFYKYLSRLQELQTQFHIINREIEHETPLYVILNNNKFDCIDTAININPFNSSHFIWMDFGINHVAKNTEIMFDWINNVPDKIKQLCINPFTENVPNKEHFRFIYHNMAGGLFSGSLENMKKYSELFKNKTEEIYNDNWYQIDEAVMTIVHKENPDLFDLYYGDYIGIISNYVSPIHSLNLILHGSQKYINNNRMKDACHVLSYCLKYFENNPNSEEVFYFIEQNIMANCYNNNSLFEGVINLINLKLSSENEYDKEKIHTLLENKKVNISHYENKELINI